MTKKEFRQKLDVYVSTMKNLNGYGPSVTELYSALGNEYAEVIAEYMSTQNPFSLAA